MLLRLCAVGGLVLLIGACAHRSGTAATTVAQSENPPQVVDAAMQHEIERTDNTQQMTKAVPVRLDNPYGDVRVRFGGYEGSLEWHTVAQNMGSSNKIAVTASAGQVFDIVARLPAGTTLAPGQRMDITAYVPDGHDVEIVTERGLIEARGLKGNLKVRSTSGDIALRGIAGRLDLETGAGNIEAQLEPALAGSEQRIATSTGNILLGIGEDLNAALKLASSGVFATEFSVEIEGQAGQEPNKRGHVAVGKPAAQIEIYSKRGEIRLLRRGEFRPA